jgi:uncharacterized membrane protein YdcZ (DUF606 family)
MNLDTILTNLANDLGPPLSALVGTISFLVGACMFLTFLLRLRTHTTAPHTVSPGGTAMMMVSSCLLLSLAATSSTLSNTLFPNGGENTFTSLAYLPSGSPGATQATAALQALFVFVNIIGYIALARSFTLFSRRANGDQHVSAEAPWLHLAGGLFAINIVAFVKAAQGDTGVTLLS